MFSHLSRSARLTLLSDSSSPASSCTDHVSNAWFIHAAKCSRRWTQSTLLILRTIGQPSDLCHWSFRSAGRRRCWMVHRPGLFQASTWPDDKPGWLMSPSCQFQVVPEWESMELSTLSAQRSFGSGSALEDPGPTAVLELRRWYIGLECYSPESCRKCNSIEKFHLSRRSWGLASSYRKRLTSKQIQRHILHLDQWEGPWSFSPPSISPQSRWFWLCVLCSSTSPGHQLHVWAWVHHQEPIWRCPHSEIRNMPFSSCWYWSPIWFWCYSGSVILWTICHNQLPIWLRAQISPCTILDLYNVRVQAATAFLGWLCSNLQILN